MLSDFADLFTCCAGIAAKMVYRFSNVWSYFFLVLLLTLRNVNCSKKSSQGALTVRFKEFTDCNKGAPNRILSAKIQMLTRGVTVMNVEWVINEPIVDGTVWVTVQRCTTDCEKYLKFPADACKMFSEKGMPWSDFLATSQPKIKCPIKKGVYRMLNATLDASSLTQSGIAFAQENYNWKSTFEIVSKKQKLLLCGYVVHTFERLKKRVRT